MWKRDEAVRSTGQPAGHVPEGRPAAGAAAPGARSAGLGQSPVNIGKSVVIKGELNGSEDLTIEGQVEGTIELRQHVLTIGSHGKIRDRKSVV